jgi:hypothetical protein
MEPEDQQYARLSFSKEGIRAFKAQVMGDNMPIDRMSAAFVIRMDIVRTKKSDVYFNVIAEISAMEKGRSTTTKIATQFRNGTALFPLWHKHFYTAQRMLKNVGVRWNIDNNGPGNDALTEMIEEVAKTHGHDPDAWPRILANKFIIGALEERSLDRRITGDWIIFAKHNGENYYLDLATHDEGKGENAIGCPLSEHLALIAA